MNREEAQLFSIVIPLYNKGPYITRAIASVLTQEGSNWELIVVDDGSTDDGPSIVDGYHHPRIRLVRQANGGASAARNRGIAEARFGFVAFLDADDWWHPGYLAKQADLIQRFPGAGIYATAHQKVYADGTIRMPAYRGFPPPPWEGVLEDYFLAAQEGAQPVWTSATVMPRSVLLEVGGFPLDLPTGQDKACWCLAALRHPVVFSHFLGASYLQDSLNNRKTRRLKRIAPLVTEGALRSGAVSGERRASVRLFNQRFRVYHAIRAVQRGHRGRALHLLWLAGWPTNGEILGQEAHVLSLWLGLNRVFAGLKKATTLLKKATKREGTH